MYDTPVDYESCADCNEPVDASRAKSVRVSRLVTLKNGETFLAHDVTYYCRDCHAQYNPNL